MPDELTNMEHSLEEQLVAYLDGELDAEASRRVEELLATDPRVRQTLQQLDRTWELLDELDKPQVAESFAQTTLEMVTVAAGEDVRTGLAETRRRRRRRWAIAGGSLLAAGLAGFLAVALFTDRNEELIQDLPVLQNLDEYCQIDSIEFLQMLNQQGLFTEENGEN